MKNNIFCQKSFDQTRTLYLLPIWCESECDPVSVFTDPVLSEHDLGATEGGGGSGGGDTDDGEAEPPQHRADTRSDSTDVPLLHVCRVDARYVWHTIFHPTSV